ncbi:site-specific integrase [Bacillus cereus]|uniref:Core-binding (CB) domain-containing protein n=1 Tax=Bacillus cereus HuA2-1 TaxID=1053201 RepID=J9BQP8_BACCE|nr:site-specific integrase [Bacillus cereus]EJV81094.1 hypothetical protein IG3_03783 [Bacillus cereus HuA2-1]
MNNFQMNVENFLLHCDSKHLSRKTIRSYDQTLKLFASYLERELKITDVDKVKPLHIRTYIKYLRERGKYTFTSNIASEQINYPTRRTDYGKTISETTIANYLRNIIEQYCDNTEANLITTYLESPHLSYRDLGCLYGINHPEKVRRILESAKEKLRKGIF